jgi:acetyltransferase-like isoleucine patch superfamily enzyme
LFERVSRRWRAFKAYRLFHQRIVVFGPFAVTHPENVQFGTGCAINHGVLIVARNPIQIGNNVVLSARAMLLAAGLDPTTFGSVSSRAYREAPIRIMDGAWIGAGAIVLAGVTIGELSIVGAGAVVTRDVPDFTVVAGNPAKFLKKVER